MADDLVQRLRACVRLKESHTWDELIEAAYALARKDAEIAELQAKVAKLRKADSDAAEYVESVICVRTRFTGNPPYVGWKGLGLALTEALDERDNLRNRAERAEARVREAPRVAVSVINGVAWVYESGDRQASLVLLDTEEAK